jgi:hypothetical protein
VVFVWVVDLGARRLNASLSVAKRKVAVLASKSAGANDTDCVSVTRVGPVDALDV